MGVQFLYRHDLGRELVQDRLDILGDLVEPGRQRQPWLDADDTRFDQDLGVPIDLDAGIATEMQTRVNAENLSLRPPLCALRTVFQDDAGLVELRPNGVGPGEVLGLAGLRPLGDENPDQLVESLLI